MQFCSWLCGSIFIRVAVVASGEIYTTNLEQLKVTQDANRKLICDLLLLLIVTLGRNPLEFIDETYLAKSRGIGMGLLFRLFFTDFPCDRQTDRRTDERAIDSIARSALSRAKTVQCSVPQVGKRWVRKLFSRAKLSSHLQNWLRRLHKC